MQNVSLNDVQIRSDRSTQNRIVSKFVPIQRRSRLSNFIKTSSKIKAKEKIESDALAILYKHNKDKSMKTNSILNFDTCSWGEWGSFTSCKQVSQEECKVLRIRYSENKEDCGNYNIEVNPCECRNSYRKKDEPDLDIRLCYVKRHEEHSIGIGEKGGHQKGNDF